jgi:hypothetical protein
MRRATLVSQYRSRFMYEAYRQLQTDFNGAHIPVQGTARLSVVAGYIFGDASYTIRWISEMVRQGHAMPEHAGRKAHFPRDAEAVLFRFVAKLRSMKLPVYRSTVIEYATRLLRGTAHATLFATVSKSLSGELQYAWDRVRVSCM